MTTVDEIRAALDAYPSDTKYFSSPEARLVGMLRDLLAEVDKLQAIADAAREIVADADRPQLARNWATDRLQSALAAYDAT